MEYVIMQSPETDINALGTINELKLHIKNLQEDLYVHYDTVKSSKAQVTTLENKQAKLQKQFNILVGISLLTALAFRFK